MNTDFLNRIKLFRVMFIDPGESSGYCLAGRYLGPEGTESEIDKFTKDLAASTATGVAHVTPNGTIIFRYGQVRDKHEAYHAHQLAIEMQIASLSRPGLHGVLIEDFILGRKEMQRNLLSPVRITAAVEQALYEWPFQNVPEDKVDPNDPRDPGKVNTPTLPIGLQLSTLPWLPKQMAADAKRAVNDARLKAAGCWWLPDRDGHARDATRHALLYWRKVGSNPATRRAFLNSVKDCLTAD